MKSEEEIKQKINELKEELIKLDEIKIQHWLIAENVFNRKMNINNDLNLLYWVLK